MDPRNQLPLETPAEAYPYFFESSSSVCSSGSSSLNSTLSAHEGSTTEEATAMGQCSSPDRQQRCLHCERQSSECICLDSEDDADENVLKHPYTEWKLHLRESFQPPASEAIIPEVISGNQTPARFPSYTSKQRVEHQQHQPLPSFEQLLASLGLAAGFVVYRSRHQ